MILAGVGGVDVSQTVEGRERYAINVRYAREFRDNPEALKRVVVATPAGPQVPLSQLAELSFSTGPPMVRSEDGRLVGFVFVDIAGRPIADFVDEARRAVAEKVDLPPGMRLEWAGQFKYLERAKRWRNNRGALDYLISNRTIVVATRHRPPVRCAEAYKSGHCERSDALSVSVAES